MYQVEGRHEGLPCGGNMWQNHKGQHKCAVRGRWPSLNAVTTHCFCALCISQWASPCTSTFDFQPVRSERKPPATLRNISVLLWDSDRSHIPMRKDYIRVLCMILIYIMHTVRFSQEIELQKGEIKILIEVLLFSTHATNRLPCIHSITLESTG